MPSKKTTAKYKRPFYNEIIKELDKLDKKNKNRYPKKDLLTIDLHCHDHNSDVPDELLGRILEVPETWLPSEDLLNSLKANGCDTFTITNHNNARSCFEMQSQGIDILTAAEFSCFVPDYKIGIHVLTYGFTQDQEKKLNKLRSNIYKFQEYTYKHDIPTIWAHPLYHYKSNGIPPLEFFKKMLLLFERFEIINGQRDTWQNMLVKLWIESITPVEINKLAQKFKIKPERYCRNPYKKSMAGGSDSHMGIFSGLTGTKLYMKDLKKKLKTVSRSQLALQAIKNGDMYPFGSYNDGEKMTIAFLDYFCQIALNMQDPGLVRLLLHKGEIWDKIIGFIIINGFAELKRHKITMQFLELFHNCFVGKTPSFWQKLFVPGVYKPIFKKAIQIAETKHENPAHLVKTFRESIYFFFDNLSKILTGRLTKKIETIQEQNNFEDKNLNNIFESLELPAGIRCYFGNESPKGPLLKEFHLNDFLDGLSFPFLASAVILSASFASTKVLYNSRPLLTDFSAYIGKLKHPKRVLWLSDTYEDGNGVAMVLNSVHNEICKKNLPIDFLICSNKLKSKDHLLVIPAIKEFTLPFYEYQPIRIPNIMDIHKIFQEGEYDRIICSTEGPMGAVALFLKTAYTVPAHFYIHTDWMMFARKVLNFDSHNVDRMRRLLRAYYHSFDKLFVLNKDQQKWLFGKEMGFKKSQLNLTAHWVDDIFKPCKADKKKIFKITNNERIILFAGRISDEKGIFELPAIYKKIKESDPDIKLAIAGKGPAEKKIKELLPDAIFLGWVEHNKLPQIYSAADLLILPSRFDTFGCVVLEALSCGLPVIAYKTKGPKEIIEDNQNGFLVNNRIEMANKIEKYFNNKELPNKFKKSALKRAKDYNAKKIMDQLMEDIGL